MKNIVGLEYYANDNKVYILSMQDQNVFVNCMVLLLQTIGLFNVSNIYEEKNCIKCQILIFINEAMSV